MKIYFAGPLFTTYERDFISACARILRAEGFTPYVPHEDFGPPDPADTRTIPKRVFDKDFGAIAASQVILAIVNGVEVDDGTACELGIFYTLMQTDPSKKGIIALHDDWRTNEMPGEGKGLNSFVLGCIRKGGVVCQSLDQAIAQLKTWRGDGVG